MPLTQQQIESLAKHLGKTKRQLQRYKPIEASVSITAEYMRGIRKIAREVTVEVKDKILPILERLESTYSTSSVFDEDVKATLAQTFDEIETALKSQQQQLDKYSRRIATKAFTAQGEFHRKAWVKEINKLAGIDIRKIMSEEAVKATLPARIEENIKLIKTVQPEYLEQVQSAVTRGVNRGDDFFSIREQLKKVETTNTKYRPKLIARDQMNKLIGALNQTRQEDVGIKEYTWRTSYDERVRPSHRANNGRVFSWAKPPATGHPGEDVQCRCVAEPKFDKWLREISEKRGWSPSK